MKNPHDILHKSTYIGTFFACKIVVDNIIHILYYNINNGGYMIYLMQIMSMLNKEERTDLIHILEDLSFELEEMGWNSDPEGLISDILFNHFGFEMEDPKQLTWLTDWVLEKQNSPQSFKALLTTVNLQKGEA